jgi:thiol-disulfide isomerase/thioredoxin
MTAMLPFGPCAAQGAPGFHPAGAAGRVCLAVRARAQQVGQPAADIKGVDQNGAAADLAQFKGKVILLDVSTMWCVWCQVDAPALENLYNTYSNKGLKVVTCLTEDSNGAAVTLAGLKQWAGTYHLTTPVMNDASGTSNGVAESAYVSASGGFPTLVLIDKSFNVQYLAGGLDLPAVTAKIQALLAQ